MKARDTIPAAAAAATLALTLTACGNDTPEPVEYSSPGRIANTLEGTAYECDESNPIINLLDIEFYNVEMLHCPQGYSESIYIGITDNPDRYLRSAARNPNDPTENIVVGPNWVIDCMDVLADWECEEIAEITGGTSTPALDSRNT